MSETTLSADDQRAAILLPERQFGGETRRGADPLLEGAMGFDVDVAALTES